MYSHLALGLLVIVSWSLLPPLDYMKMDAWLAAFAVERSREGQMRALGPVPFITQLKSIPNHHAHRHKWKEPGQHRSWRGWPAHGRTRATAHQRCRSRRFDGYQIRVGQVRSSDLGARGVGIGRGRREAAGVTWGNLRRRHRNARDCRGRRIHGRRRAPHCSEFWIERRKRGDSMREKGEGRCCHL
jgi:hypothetical protein